MVHCVRTRHSATVENIVDQFAYWMTLKYYFFYKTYDFTGIVLRVQIGIVGPIIVPVAVTIPVTIPIPSCLPL